MDSTEYQDHFNTEEITIKFNSYEKHILDKLLTEAKKRHKTLLLNEYLEELFHTSFENKFGNYQ